jgi:hypothetical protein
MEVDSIKTELKTEVKTEANEDEDASASIKEEPASDSNATPKAEAMDENSQSSSLDIKPASVEPGSSASTPGQVAKPCNKKGEQTFLQAQKTVLPLVCCLLFFVCFFSRSFLLFAKCSASSVVVRIL